MTLSEQATFICNKLSDTDADSVAACKGFINRRYQMVWDSALWQESLGIVSKDVTASTETITLDSTPSITFFQSAVAPTTALDFPVAMRFTVTGQTDGLEMTGHDWATFFQLDPNVWNNVAGRNTTPKNFINLPKDGSGYPRIKPVPVPDMDGTGYVLGKLKWVALTDNDTPCLRGIDNVLLAFAEGDMLERGRQYGKAQNKYAEAAAGVKIMTDLEKGQQQSISSVTPLEEGYYDPTGGPS
jgi:hypothetical protein